MVYIIMGVSGSGKTRIGKSLAASLKLPFYDGDDYHPDNNITKMKSGKPLDDNDRNPWLQILARQIEKWENEGGAILACSALKEKYRSTLQMNRNYIQFIYLRGNRELIKKRLSKRKNHYMPSELIDSQFDTLEEPKNAIVTTIEKRPEIILQRILKSLKQKPKGDNHENI